MAAARFFCVMRAMRSAESMSIDSHLLRLGAEVGGWTLWRPEEPSTAVASSPGAAKVAGCLMLPIDSSSLPAELVGAFVTAPVVVFPLMRAVCGRFGNAGGMLAAEYSTIINREGPLKLLG
jgi:hypothetical protein